MNFDANGSLPAGFHDLTYDEFYDFFVTGFPSSQRRQLIAESLLDFSAEVFAIGIPCEFWIDGSYATTKINPNDADIILFLQYKDMQSLEPLRSTFRQKYQGILDIYFWYAKSPENQGLLSATDYQNVINTRNYWRGQFGFDREDKPKGIIRIDCKSISEKIRGR